jgi:hypothetical protein
MYDDAHANVLEVALPIQMSHKSKRIRRKRRNLECKNYDFNDSTKLVQTLSIIYAFCKVGRHAIIICP